MSEFNIENKKSLDKEKLIDRILVCVLIVFCVVLTVMGIDIEKKLNKLNETAPVANITQTSNTVSTDYYYSTNNTTTLTSPAEQTIPSEIQAGSTAQETTAVLSSETSAPSSAYTETTATTIPPTDTSTTSITSQTTAPVIQSTSHPTTTEKKTGDGKYYITASGKKYHQSFCTYLSKTKIEISLDEALSKGYEPCSRCID